MDILKRIREYLTKRSQPAKSGNPLPPASTAASQQAQLDDLMEMLAHTADEEISCDDVHRLMAQYAELFEQGSQPEELMPLVRQHLEICSECEEELEMLLDILKSTN